METESLFDHSGRVGELAAEDAVCFAGLAEDSACGGGVGAEDEVVFFAEARHGFGMLVHFVAEPLYKRRCRVLPSEEKRLDLVHGVADEGCAGWEVGHS